MVSLALPHSGTPTPHARPRSPPTGCECGSGSPSRMPARHRRRRWALSRHPLTAAQGQAALGRRSPGRCGRARSPPARHFRNAAPTAHPRSLRGRCRIRARLAACAREAAAAQSNRAVRRRAGTAVHAPRHPARRTAHPRAHTLRPLSCPPRRCRRAPRAPSRASIATA